MKRRICRQRAGPMRSPHQASCRHGVEYGSARAWSIRRTLTVEAPPEVVFKCIERIGGDHGWYAWNWLWRVRGFIDLLQGGVGLRRGRPSPTTLRVGDTVDSFRVESIEPNRRLRLKSEMYLHGRAWLEFEVTECRLFNHDPADRNL